MRAYGVVGHQDSGKTHLICRLLAEFGRRGLAVSTIKHTHHHAVEFEPPGKDSARHRAAGAREVIVASDTGWTLLRQRTVGAPQLDDLLGQLAPCDLVLVEGYRSAVTVPRLEVFRGGAGRTPLALLDRAIRAVACPAGLDVAGLAVPRLDLDATAAVADFILADGTLG